MAGSLAARIAEAGERRRIPWDRARSPVTRLAIAIGTFLGFGLLPLAPGTWGTLVAVPLFWALVPCGLGAKLAVCAGLTALGTWAGTRYERAFGVSDHQSIVIDEVIGFGLAALTLERDVAGFVAAFVLFRAFDMLKPPPIRAVDRWSKSVSTRLGPRTGPWLGGLGVMLDDILAGALACACVSFAQHQGWLAN